MNSLEISLRKKGYHATRTKEGGLLVSPPQTFQLGLSPTVLNIRNAVRNSNGLNHVEIEEKGGVLNVVDTDKKIPVITSLLQRVTRNGPLRMTNLVVWKVTEPLEDALRERITTFIQLAFDRGPGNRGGVQGPRDAANSVRH